MDNTVIWIVLAVIVVIVLLVAVLAGRKRHHTRMHGKAEEIRAEVAEHTEHVDRREALAGETAAKARAAKAEAEAKAAEAARLQERADGMLSDAGTARDELDARREHADTIDPKVR